VLRFWESRFREIRPMKRGGGRRYYRPEDVALLRGIRHLLYGEGYTIRGVQRLLREQGQHFVQAVWQPGAPRPAHEPAADAVAETVERPEAIGREREPRLRPPRSSAERPDPSAHEGVRAARVIEPRVGVIREDLQKLRAVLDDLGECRRLLDAALSDRSNR
jgi:DNA-binding transcriptional MerR regulator